MGKFDSGMPAGNGAMVDDCGFADQGLRGLLSVFAMSMLIAACAQQAPVVKPDRPPLNLSGFSAPFKEGFADGCETARGRPQKAEDRYKTDNQYARGWEDGRAICARR